MNDYQPESGDGDLPPGDLQEAAAHTTPTTDPTPVADDDPITVLVESVEQLGRQVDWAVDQLTEHPAGGPWWWDGLDASRQAQLWAEVAEFAMWAQRRILAHVTQTKYAILPCWYRHPDVVEYLTALMVAHKAAYQAKSSKATRSLTDFWVRDFWPVMNTIKDHSSMNRCTARDGHKDGQPDPLTIDQPEHALVELMTPPPETTDAGGGDG